MKAAKVLKVNDDDVTKDDVLEGLTAVVTVRLAEPQFEGQTKEILGTPAGARRRAQGGLGGAEEVPHLDQARREGPGPAGHGEGRRRGQDPDRGPPAPRDPAPQERPGVLGAAGQAGRLPRHDDERSELFIVEGDSALGTAKLARNSEFQALLPIRGKILNVQKASVGDMLKNAECASIIQVVGAGSGPHLRHRGDPLRQDHLHGGRRLRRRAHPLPAGHAVLQVHARARARRAASSPPCPPLHRIEISNPKKGMDKYVYTYSDDELQRKLAELTKKGVSLEGPGPALQGARRDGRRPAGRDHDGPAPPHPAPAHRRRRRGRREGLRAADGLRRRAAQGVPRPGRLRGRRETLDA